MKQLIRRVATLAALTGGAIFVRWWLSQQDDNNGGNSRPNQPELPPSPDMSTLIEDQQIIVLPPEAFAGTRTTGTYIVPHSNGNGALYHQDDLTAVAGITEELEQALKENGILSFMDLAHANPVVVQEQLRATFPVGLETIETWIAAARERVIE